MRNKMLLLVVAGAVLLVGVVIWTSKAERPVEFYATYEDAVASGAAERGWIPHFMPESTTEILEVHDLDTNQQWIRFRLPVANAQQLSGSFQRISVAEARTCAGRPPQVIEEWPSELTGPIAVTPKSARYFKDDSVSDEPVYFALAWSSADSVATGFAWSCAS